MANKTVEGFFYREVGRRIRRAREARGLTQAQLASGTSLTRTSITNIEKGRQKLLVHTLSDIAFALTVKPSSLVPPLAAASPEDIDVKIPTSFSEKERDHIRRVLTSLSSRRT